MYLNAAREGGVRSDVVEMIGRTPLVHLANVSRWTILLKLECANPSGSMKDRIARQFVLTAEKTGVLRPGGTLIESSSGNTASALAMVAAARGYKFIAVMDGHASREKIDVVRAYGAEVVVVAENAGEGVVSAAARRTEVERLLTLHPDAVFTNQADNPENAEAYTALAAELEDAIGDVNVLCASVGSGGALCGTGRELRRRGQQTMIVAVEPTGSVTFGGSPGPYLQSGPGTPGGFEVAQNVDFSLIDAHYSVNDCVAFNTARAVARRTGLLVGGSTGAAIYVCLKMAEYDTTSRTAVVLAADRGEKYLSTIFSDAWMQERRLLDDAVSGYVSELLEASHLS